MSPVVCAADFKSQLPQRARLGGVGRTESTEAFTLELFLFLLLLGGLRPLGYKKPPVQTHPSVIRKGIQSLSDIAFGL